MHLDITGEKTAIPVEIFGWNFEIFKGLIYLLLILLFMLILGLIININIKKQKINKAPSSLLIIMEKLFDFSQKTVGNFKNKNLQNNMSIFFANLFVFMFLINSAGIWGIEPPAANFFIALALGIFIALIVHIGGIFLNKMHYLKEYANPNVLFLPLNIVESFSQIISISMRLFGNMLAGVVLAELLKMFLCSIGLSAFILVYPLLGGMLSIYSDLFIAAIQTLIFTSLAISYIKDKFNA